MHRRLQRDRGASQRYELGHAGFSAPNVMTADGRYDGDEPVVDCAAPSLLIALLPPCAALWRWLGLLDIDLKKLKSCKEVSSK